MNAGHSLSHIRLNGLGNCTMTEAVNVVLRNMSTARSLILPGRETEIDVRWQRLKRDDSVQEAW